MTPREAAEELAKADPDAPIGGFGASIDVLTDHFARAVPTATGDLRITDGIVESRTDECTCGQPPAPLPPHEPHCGWELVGYLTDAPPATKIDRAGVDAVVRATFVEHGISVSDEPIAWWAVRAVLDMLESSLAPLAVGNEVESAEKLAKRAVEGTIVEDATRYATVLGHHQAEADDLTYPVVVRYVPEASS